MTEGPWASSGCLPRKARPEGHHGRGFPSVTSTLGPRGRRALGDCRLTYSVSGLELQVGPANSDTFVRAKSTIEPSTLRMRSQFSPPHATAPFGQDRLYLFYLRRNYVSFTNTKSQSIVSRFSRSISTRCG